jgi:hypothetical protein
MRNSPAPTTSQPTPSSARTLIIEAAGNDLTAKQIRLLECSCLNSCIYSRARDLRAASSITNTGVPCHSRDVQRDRQQDRQGQRGPAPVDQVPRPRPPARSRPAVPGCRHASHRPRFTWLSLIRPSVTPVPDTENLRQRHQPRRAGPALACAVVTSACAGGGVLAGRRGPGRSRAPAVFAISEGVPGTAAAGCECPRPRAPGESGDCPAEQWTAVSWDSHAHEPGPFPPPASLRRRRPGRGRAPSHCARRSPVRRHGVLTNIRVNHKIGVDAKRRLKP